MSARKQHPERRPPTSTADAAARLAKIVEAAEQAASKAIDDAEQEAQRLLDEARERADGIVAERLRELADELDHVGVGEGLRAPHLEPVESPDQLEEPQDAGPKRRSGSAGARLLATQMAVSGADRAEIEARLRNGFEIDDTSEILDAILGPEE